MAAVEPIDPGLIARTRAPRWLRHIGVALAVIYLSAVWLDAAGTGLPTWALPRPILFFCQVAQLFPHANEQIIEWHAKGYRCASHRYEELDVRPYFQIHADDKENRFDRAMFFYLKEPEVLRALDAYLSAREGERGPDQRIGGVMLLSVRLPIPAPGEVKECYRRQRLDEEPRDAERKYWYATPAREREQRCLPTP